MTKLVPVADIFSVTYGTSLELNSLDEEENGVAFVSRTTRNNGVSARVAKLEEVEPIAGGTLSVALGGTPMTTFLQDEPYYTGRDVAVLTPIEAMSREELLFYATALGMNRYKFSYGRQANRSLSALLVPSRGEIPAWVRAARIDSPTTLWPAVPDEKFSLQAPTSKALVTKTWKPFVYEQLFDIKKGKRLTKDDMQLGDTAFIGATDSNNGVTARIANEPRHPAGTITVSYNGSVGEAFYQTEPFWASDDVNVFYPRFKMSREVAMFLVAVIRLEKFRYNYGRKWTLENMKSTTCLLPVAANGEPDWAYMTRTVKACPSFELLSLLK